MRLFLISLSLVMSALLNAQAPAFIPYQAIARNAAGEPLANSPLNARFIIHNGNATGIVIWQELQTVSTNALGLFTVQLGSTIPLTNVNWSNGAKFLEVEIDLGNGFVDIGTQQLLSVPYALHAGSVHLNVSATGDTLFVGNGSFVIIPGISEANNIGNGGTSTGSTFHSCGAPNIHNPNLNYGSMTDQEGNVYKTIVIGTQEWMAENLNTSVYRNGDAIATGLTSSEWQNSINTSQGAWTYYNNDVSYSCPYGKWYNSYACVDSRRLCPVGWHVPSDQEWTTLISYLGGEDVAGGKMKSTGTVENGTGYWNSPNTDATNSSGFSGIPGDFSNYIGEFTNYLGSYSYYWSSSQIGTIDAWMRTLYTEFGFGLRGVGPRQNGLSVRCIRDTITGVIPGDNHNCGTPNIHNSALSYGSMNDQEGNSYKTIVIGAQEWMAENLNTSIYRNGDSIITQLDAATWQTTTTGASSIYNDDSNYVCPYGRLYNWYACVDPRQLCPAGWHVPSYNDWSELTAYLGGESDAGGKMKTTGIISAETGLWYFPNTGASNSSGFSGVPGGYRLLGGQFGSLSGNGCWWSSTSYDNTSAWFWLLNHGNSNAHRDGNVKQNGFSVRCLRD